MTRWKRILLELLGPPGLGATIFVVGMGVLAARQELDSNRPLHWDWEYLEFYVVVLLFAYLYAGVPSVLYTMVMEWRFRRGLNPASWRAIRLSTILGFISGLVPALIILPSLEAVPAYAIWGGLGAVVGFLLGLFIKRLTERAARRAAIVTTTALVDR